MEKERTFLIHLEIQVEINFFNVNFMLLCNNYVIIMNHI